MAFTAEARSQERKPEAAPAAGADTRAKILADYEAESAQVERRRLERLARLAEGQPPAEASRTYADLFRYAIEAGLSAEALAALEAAVEDEAATLIGSSRTEVAGKALANNGWLVLDPKVGRYGTDYRLVHAIATTMKAVFPNVYLIDVGRFSNTMVIATKQPTDLANYAANIAQLPQGSPLRQIGDLSIQTGNIRPWDGGGLVFSDNRAPVELVIDRLIIDAARHETQNR